jgi:hypothetical protein
LKINSAGKSAGRFFSVCASSALSTRRMLSARGAATTSDDGYGGLCAMQGGLTVSPELFRDRRQAIFALYRYQRP